MHPRSGRMSLLLRKFSNLMLRPTPSLQTLLQDRLILTPLLKVPIILLALVFNSYVFIWLWDFVVVLKFSTHKVLIFFFFVFSILCFVWDKAVEFVKILSDHNCYDPDLLYYTNSSSLIVVLSPNRYGSNF